MMRRRFADESARRRSGSAAFVVGATVTAKYGSAQTNTLTGTVAGRTLRGTWKEASSSGRFYFTIATDGSSFKGAYGSGAEPPTSAWTGTKA